MTEEAYNKWEFALMNARAQHNKKHTVGAVVDERHTREVPPKHVEVFEVIPVHREARIPIQPVPWARGEQEGKQTTAVIYPTRKCLKAFHDSKLFPSMLNRFVLMPEGEGRAIKQR